MKFLSMIQLSTETCISHKKASHHTMGTKSFAMMFLFCLILLLALLWQFEINHFSDALVEISVKNHTKKSIRENTSHRTANQAKPALVEISVKDHIKTSIQEKTLTTGQPIQAKPALVEISVKNHTKKSIRENTSHRTANQTKPTLVEISVKDHTKKSIRENTSHRTANPTKPTLVEISVKDHIKKSIRKNTSHWTAHQTKPWLIIYWSTYFQKQLHISIVWKKGECPVPCEVTSDRSRASDAKGFIVHARDSHMIPPTESVPWILLTQENPVYTSSLTNAKFMSKFKLLRSYRLDSDFPDSTFWMPSVAPPLPFKDKDGLIMAAFSNCEPVRTEYMRQLMKFVQVDSYGACLKNKNGLVRRYGTQNGKDFRDVKAELAKKYKFTLVFFNQDCDYFVDAQLTHALHAGSVPVVMSTNKLDEFLPGNLRHSVIKVRDFRSPRHLADYLNILTIMRPSITDIWSGSGKELAILLELLLEITGNQSIQSIAKSALHCRRGECTRMVFNQSRARQGALKTGE
ncbi:hypothetical protein OS493_003965 [Desmophyllum pertusum]|uniref:Fucosyltransferase n=1 Tax=Desmophyllum pertusum TaxID=174260 RepID=A0A9W9ZSP3_9CNID|nr:hypothetical protein OS493_003965 [Desmophyllum pertusum]